MTFNPSDQSLVIIGGFSENGGFNDIVLVQAKHGRGPLRGWPTRGYSPLSGIYGHTTVYNSAMASFYVYGGVSYSAGRVQVSNALFVLHYPTRRWSVVSKTYTVIVFTNFDHCLGLNLFFLIILHICRGCFLRNNFYEK